MSKQNININKVDMYSRTYKGKFIVKYEKVNDIVQETYIEADGEKVWLVTYLNYQESSRSLVATL